MKVILIQILLFMVLLVGAPIHRPVRDFAYELLRRAGLDVPMTPMTADMAMMTDLDKNLIYKKSLQLVVSGEEGVTTVLPPEDLDFHQHKIPFNLYYEMLSYGGSAPESRFFICRSLSKVAGFKVVKFSLNTYEQKIKKAGFNEYQICPY